MLSIMLGRVIDLEVVGYDAVRRRGIILRGTTNRDSQALYLSAGYSDLNSTNID